MWGVYLFFWDFALIECGFCSGGGCRGGGGFLGGRRGGHGGVWANFIWILWGGGGGGLMLGGICVMGGGGYFGMGGLGWGLGSCEFVF